MIAKRETRNPSGSTGVQARDRPDEARGGRTVKARILIAPLLALTMLAGACGRLNGNHGNDPGSGGGISHPTGADQLVLRMDVGGGFVAPSYSLRQIPAFSLYGDGSLITEGPQIEIYPGPALPNLLVQTISEDGVQAILAAAKDAGLLGPDHSYDYMTVSDAPTTTFTVNADGSTHVISAYALAMGQGNAGPDKAPLDALAAFAAKLGDLSSWLPNGAVGDQTQFDPSGLRVYVQDYSQAGDGALPEATVDWPLAQPLASFGDPLENLVGTSCGAVTGSDFATLYPLVKKANEITPWLSEGTKYLLLFRPLLPGEQGC
jgi:hypothetical protein